MILNSQNQQINWKLASKDSEKMLRLKAELEPKMSIEQNGPA